MQLGLRAPPAVARAPLGDVPAQVLLNAGTSMPYHDDIASMSCVCECVRVAADLLGFLAWTPPAHDHSPNTTRMATAVRALFIVLCNTDGTV